MRPGDLVTKNDWKDDAHLASQHCWCVVEREIGAADAARINSDDYVIAARFRLGHLSDDCVARRIALLD